MKIKDKEKNLESSQRGGNTLGTEEQRMASDFLSETMQGREQWNNVLKLLREKGNTAKELNINFYH